jgi:hypothetical protein
VRRGLGNSLPKQYAWPIRTNEGIKAFPSQLFTFSHFRCSRPARAPRGCRVLFNLTAIASMLSPSASIFSKRVRWCFCFAGFTGRILAQCPRPKTCDPRGARRHCCEDTHLTTSQTSGQSKLNVRLTARYGKGLISSQALAEKNGSFNGTGDRFGS